MAETVYKDVDDETDPLAGLPPELLDALSPEQKASLWNALNTTTWRRHPVNIRLSTPLFGRRVFLTIVAGADRRSEGRVKREGRMHPLLTLGNVLFSLGVAAFFYIMIVLAIVGVSSVLEP